MYPFQDYWGQPTACMKAGERNFDLNEDGLAHYGLIPDLIADMKMVGGSSDEIDRLLRSADAYVETWDRAERGYLRPSPTSGGRGR